MNKIVVLGSSNTDLVVRTGRMPLPGETLLGEQFMMTAGGKGANQAVAVSRLGDGVTFIAKVGRDMFGDSSVAGYEKEGIDTRTVLRDDTAPSGIAVITVDAQAENSIVVVPGANNNLSKADVDALRRDIESAQFLLMQLETPVEVVAHAAAMARKAGVKVILNPAPAAELPAELLDGLYIITPNRTEGQMLTGIEISDWESAERAAQSLVSKGVQNVVITLGSQGAGLRRQKLRAHPGPEGQGRRHHRRRRHLQRRHVRGPLRGGDPFRRRAVRFARFGHRRHPPGRSGVDSLPQRAGRQGVTFRQTG